MDDSGDAASERKHERSQGLWYVTAPDLSELLAGRRRSTAPQEHAQELPFSTFSEELQPDPRGPEFLSPVTDCKQKRRQRKYDRLDEG